MQFEKQQFQEDCINNIVEILGNCDINNDFAGLPQAIRELNKNKGYHQFQTTDKKRLDVLMETGTGKTFTYLKTIFELNREFKQNKFIIVVPRTAIKLGVIQNIRLTDSFFFNEYKKHLKFIDYPKDGLTKIQNDFLKTDDLCVLITTNSAFNSEKNKINQRQETLFQFPSTWAAIHDKKPIIIIDEPHLLKGTETQKGLDKINNCLQIRFGATYPTDNKDKAYHLGNVVYSLDSISAFNEYLVKRIQVNTVFTAEEESDLKLISTQVHKNTFIVSYAINEVCHTTSIRKGDDIGTVTGLTHYQGISATNITSSYVALNNSTKLELIQGGYNLGEDEIRAMVQKTIRTHFDKEEKLFNEGIKTLSLFFIPQVADFRVNENNPTPRVKTIFEEVYQQIRQEIYNKTNNTDYKKYLEEDYDEEGKLKVHDGYFSGDKGSNDAKEADGVNLILNHKEALLSFRTPLRFIFSVWALQEGWDNPNVFNICKLAATTKDTSRRQQVGRGLRLAVNQQGRRLTYLHLKEQESPFYDINTLDMVVSAQEKEFIQSIQQEIQQASYSLVGDTLTLEQMKELGLSDIEAARLFTRLEDNNIINFEGKIQSSIYSFIKNNKNQLAALNLSDERYNQLLERFKENRQSVIDGNAPRKKVKIRTAQWQKFKQLWETINKNAKIVYRNIQEESIIDEVSKKFNNIDIPEITTYAKTELYDAHTDTITTVREDSDVYRTNATTSHYFNQQDINEYFDYIVKKEKIPMPFAIKLLNAINKEQFRNNPKKARELLLSMLKDTIHGTVIGKVEYQFLDTSIYHNSLQDKSGNLVENILYTNIGRYYTDETVPQNLLYDTVCYDSDIEKTSQQNDPPEVNDQTITVFAKLPSIGIPTPYKTYNPDFAYLVERQGKKQLFLIVEAKGYENSNDIPAQEQQKIDYAEKFFSALGAQLPDIEIQYKTRLNATLLNQLLESNH